MLRRHAPRHHSSEIDLKILTFIGTRGGAHLSHGAIVAAGMQLHPFLEHTGPLAFAHRGGTDSAPENTLAAFQAAVDLGYSYLETDVHLTADGVLVAYHDRGLGRMTDTTGNISELTWSEIRSVKVGGSEAVPLAEELLSAFPEAKFNIDPKSDRSVGPLVDLLARTGSTSRVCIGSFSDRRLAEVRRRLPGVCTSAGPREVAMIKSGRPLALARRLGRADCLQIPVGLGKIRLLTSRLTGTAHALGMPVHIWTVNDAEEIDRLLDLGIDGLMTDRLQLLKDVFERRGLSI